MNIHFRVLNMSIGEACKKTGFYYILTSNKLYKYEINSKSYLKLIDNLRKTM